MKGIRKDWRTKTKVLHNPDLMSPGESVTIKGYFSDQDRNAVLSASVIQVRTDEGEVVTRATLDRLRATKLQIAVVGWQLQDEEGTPLPFDRDTLMALPSSVCDWLIEEIDREWDGLGVPVADPEEAKRREQEAKERHSTFQRDGLPAAVGQEADGGSDDGRAAGDPGRRRAGIAG